MEDLETQFSLAQKRHLVDLKKWLDRQRAYKEKIGGLEAILADKGRKEDHQSARKQLKSYQRKLANADEGVQLNMHILGLLDKKLDLQKKLAEISDGELEV